MNSDALGMVETRGLVAAIEAADAMAKAANVKVLGWRNVDQALISVLCRGSVGDVQAATDAGAQAARRVGELHAVHVIPAPFGDIDEYILNRPK
ncbi:MAG: BMC domain-containing protein [Candidatus Eremiobacterota bacterium]